jgi:hypothetical protein
VFYKVPFHNSGLASNRDNYLEGMILLLMKDVRTINVNNPPETKIITLRIYAKNRNINQTNDTAVKSAVAPGKDPVF